MTIKEIKATLPILDLLSSYGHRVDQRNRLLCPFHPDKTPSMQVYPETGTVYCFSSNCPTHGHSLDQIDFILHQENCTKRQAIAKAKGFCAPVAGGSSAKKSTSQAPELQRVMSGTEAVATAKRVELLEKFYRASLEAMAKEPVRAKTYLRSRCLEGLEVGWLSADCFKDFSEEEEKRAEKIGLLKKSGRSYKPKFHSCLVFALRNPSGKVIDLYFRSVLDKADSKHFYLPGKHQGLYPGYPAKDTQKLIFCESVIDAASLPNLPQTSVLALYGAGGGTPEHWEAIKSLKGLNEIILFFDGDEAGSKAVARYGDFFNSMPIEVRISRVPGIRGEDPNSIKVKYRERGPQIFISLLNRRMDWNKDPRKVAPVAPKLEKEKGKTPGKLCTDNPKRLLYPGIAAHYTIAGGLKSESDSLRVSLCIQNGSSRKYRGKVDLYEDRQVSKCAKEAGEKLDLRPDLLEQDLNRLTDALETYKETRIEAQSPQVEKVKVPFHQQKKCMDFLKAPKLMERLNAKIGESGVVGEEANRLFLFLVMFSFKMPQTLHALVQGSSGSGKSHLIERVSKTMPPESVIALTRVTENSFYNYPENFLSHKLLIIEDLDGLKEEAEFALRELQSKKELTSSTSGKDEQGNIQAYIRRVKGPISSTGATTRGNIYEDNSSRCFLLAVDESEEQTRRIIAYQNQKSAGQILSRKEKETQEFLQHCVRLLQSLEVVNPYADQVHLPPEAHKIRRLNALYQAVVRQVVLLHQYQRKRDRQGRLIAEPQDLQLACEVMFESIVLKVDELDGELRGFFEELKSFVSARSKYYEFSQLEIRKAFRRSKSQVQRYINSLLELEYIYQSGGYINKGLLYKIHYWDDIERIRAKLKADLSAQLEQLKSP